MSWRDGFNYWSKKFNEFGNDFKSGVEGFANGITLGGSSDIYGANKNLLGLTAQENVEIERQREDTRYQRLINDLTAAGLNPSSVLGGSGGAVPSNGVSGSVGSNVGSLGAILSSVADAGLNLARKDNIEADTRDKLAKAFGQELDNGFKEKLGFDEMLKRIENLAADTEAKKFGTNLTIQRFQTEQFKTETAKTESEIVKFKKLMEEGKYNEAKDLSIYNENYIINVSKSMLISAGVDVAVFGGGKAESSNSATYPVPIQWYWKASDPNASADSRKFWASKLAGLIPNKQGATK